MRRYKVGRVSSFPLPGGKVVAYLVHKEGKRYFSYGFDPRKPGSLRYAKRNFRKSLKLKIARRYNPDGGYLDGRDFHER